MQDQWVEWLQTNRRHFFYGIICIIAVFFLSFQLYEKFHKPESKNFFSANHAIEKWMQQDQAFENLEKAMRENPALETKFGALIADRFILKGEGEKAQPFAKSVFARVLSQLPEHTAFAESSLLIASGSLKDALSKAVALKERARKDSILYGFNLVRMASLYRVLEEFDQELVVLEELEFYLKEHQECGALLTECFKEGEFTLSDYIQDRKSN